jgi:hypothetical protein
MSDMAAARLYVCWASGGGTRDEERESVGAGGGRERPYDRVEDSSSPRVVTRRVGAGECWRSLDDTVILPGLLVFHSVVSDEELDPGVHLSGTVWTSLRLGPKSPRGPTRFHCRWVTTGRIRRIVL